MNAMLHDPLLAFKLFGEDGVFGTTQIILMVLLVALVIFYWQYKKRQQ